MPTSSAPDPKLVIRGFEGDDLNAPPGKPIKKLFCSACYALSAAKLRGKYAIFPLFSAEINSTDKCSVCHKQL